MMPLFWIKAVITGLVIVAIGLAINWFLDYEQGIGYDRRTAEYTKQENEDLKAALIETERLNNLVKEANNAALKREEANRALSVRNTALLGRLRDTDASINSLLSSATANALANATRAYSGLFAECRGTYEAMGRAAAGHLSDVKKLEASWPTGVQP